MRLRYLSPLVYASVTLAQSPNTQRFLIINPTTNTISESYTYSQSSYANTHSLFAIVNLGLIVPFIGSSNTSQI